jgi:hypothetical protein
MFFSCLTTRSLWSSKVLNTSLVLSVEALSTTNTSKRAYVCARAARTQSFSQEALLNVGMAMVTNGSPDSKDARFDVIIETSPPMVFQRACDSPALPQPEKLEPSRADGLQNLQ